MTRALLPALLGASLMLSPGCDPGSRAQAGPQRMGADAPDGTDSPFDGDAADAGPPQGTDAGQDFDAARGVGEPGDVGVRPDAGDAWVGDVRTVTDAGAAPDAPTRGPDADPDAVEEDGDATVDAALPGDGAPECLALAPPLAPCDGLDPAVARPELRWGLDLDAVGAPRAGERPCTPEEAQAAFEGGGASVRLECSLTFPEGAVLRKNLVLRGEGASRVTVDCNGGVIAPAEPDRYTVRIQSDEAAGGWSRPSGVRIVDCEIRGAVRIIGLGRNGEAEGVRLSSLDADHTARAQAAAPTDILFHRVHIIADGTIPFYVAPGGTHVKLVDSRLSGQSGSTAIYLDAESAYNVIQGNELATRTAIEREVLAVDGSAHNLVAGNVFASLHRGGIYVYRNCGEGGTVRHQEPRFNRFVNNFFDYEGEVGVLNPSIWLGTRGGVRPYCGADAGHDFGSSVSDLDFADYNLVAHNQVRGRPAADQIWDAGDGNLVVGNEQVRAREARPSPCAFFDTCEYRVTRDGACIEWDGAALRCRDGHLLER